MAARAREIAWTTLKILLLAVAGVAALVVHFVVVVGVFLGVVVLAWALSYDNETINDLVVNNNTDEALCFSSGGYPIEECYQEIAPHTSEPVSQGDCYGRGWVTLWELRDNKPQQIYDRIVPCDYDDSQITVQQDSDGTYTFSDDLPYGGNPPPTTAADD